MSPRAGAIAVLLAAAAGLGSVLITASAYVPAPSFPTDDAWALAASARALATTGRFEQAAGFTSGPASPLWAAAMAAPHLAGASTIGVVLVTKLVGFALHVAAALVLFSALRAGGGLSVERLLGPFLVAFHPDLVSASLSGVEVPLAALMGASLLLAACRGGVALYGGLALLAPFARPELAVLSLVFPFALHAHDRPRLWRLAGAGAAGTIAAFGSMAAGLLPWSHVPRYVSLPGASSSAMGGIAGSEMTGFMRVLDQFPVADAGLLVLVAAVAALAIAMFPRVAAPDRVAAAAMLGGLAFCAVAFALLPPAMPAAFSAQRSALPALPLLVGAIPALACEAARRALPARAAAVARVAVPLLLLWSVALDAPTRYRYLANDAKNVDEIQVAMARALAGEPGARVVWASEGGGAIRYFTGAAVVDLAPARTGPLPSADVEAILDRHRPSFIEVIPGVSSIQGDATESLRALAFRTTTADTVGGTGSPTRQRWLVACLDASSPYRFHAGERAFAFRCGKPAAAPVAQSR